MAHFQLVEIPPGHRKDHMGRLVPEAQIKAIDLARDSLVREIVDKARVQRDQLAHFKRATFQDIAAFVELSCEEYGVSLGGKKGNVSLTSFDGRYKVLRAVQENITFDERLKAAKELIDQCLNSWSEGASPNLKTIVQDAFQVDQEGSINIRRVLELRRLNIDDGRWKRAMQAIGDAVQVVSSKSYLRVYERVGETQHYKQIALDVSAVEA